MKPGYDKIAWCYDVLSYMIFGNAIKKAQYEMLHLIPAKCKILIAGGGTGWILEKITAIHSSGLSIMYIDASKKMIEIAKKRNIGLNTLHFINNPIEKINLDAEIYDVILTPFFFDNFPQGKCRVIFDQLHLSLKKNALWLFTDFILDSKTKYWQKCLLKCMYIFFRAMCRLEASRLPHISSYFLTAGYRKISEKLYFKAFIIAAAFTKASE